MKLFRMATPLLLTAVCSAAPVQEEPEPESSQLDKRTLDWKEIAISTSCMGCLAAEARKVGLPGLSLTPGAVPTAHSASWSTMVAMFCTSVCQTTITATVPYPTSPNNHDNPEVYLPTEKTWTELTWVTYITGMSDIWRSHSGR